MKTHNLLPNSFKMIGWIIFIPSFLLGILALTPFLPDFTVTLPVFYNSGYPLSGEETGFFISTAVPVAANIAGIFIIAGGLLIACSKEKQEDEYIARLRLKSVFWSFTVSYTAAVLLFLTIFGMLFLTVMILFVFLPLVLYIFRFHYLLLQK